MLNLEVDRAVEAANQYFINSYLKKTQQKQKTFISLTGKNLKQHKSFDLKIANWPSVNKLDISENQHLKDITQVIQKFPAVDFASMSKKFVKFRQYKPIVLAIKYMEKIEVLTTESKQVKQFEEPIKLPKYIVNKFIGEYPNIIPT